MTWGINTLNKQAKLLQQTVTTKENVTTNDHEGDMEREEDERVYLNVAMNVALLDEVELPFISPHPQCIAVPLTLAAVGTAFESVWGGSQGSTQDLINIKETEERCVSDPVFLSSISSSFCVAVYSSFPVPLSFQPSLPIVVNTQGDGAPCAGSKRKATEINTQHPDSSTLPPSGQHPVTLYPLFSPNDMCVIREWVGVLNEGRLDETKEGGKAGGFDEWSMALMHVLRSICNVTYDSLCDGLQTLNATISDGYEGEGRKVSPCRIDVRVVVEIRWLVITTLRNSIRWRGNEDADNLMQWVDVWLKEWANVCFECVHSIAYCSRLGSQDDKGSKERGGGGGLVGAREALVEFLLALTSISQTYPGVHMQTSQILLHNIFSICSSSSTISIVGISGSLNAPSASSSVFPPPILCLSMWEAYLISIAFIRFASLCNTMQCSHQYLTRATGLLKRVIHLAGDVGGDQGNECDNEWLYDNCTTSGIASSDDILNFKDVVIEGPLPKHSFSNSSTMKDLVKRCRRKLKQCSVNQ